MKGISNIIKKAFHRLKIVLYYQKNAIAIYGTKETLEQIINNNSSICRFGDGEFSLITGNSLAFQKYEEELGEKLKHILKTEDCSENCLVCIPAVFGDWHEYTNESVDWWYDYQKKARKTIDTLLNPDYRYYDSQVTRIYINRKNKAISEEYFELWKRVWKGKRLLIVEGSLTRFGVGNSLLNGASSVKRIICPYTNAYSEYTTIIDAIRKNRYEFDLVLIALGPTATVLAYELAKENIWALDVGNLDIEYEWKRMGKKQNVAGKYSIEVENGSNPEMIEDCSYAEQIISVIEG